MNKTILNSKPPIFWKDREIIKRQITKWKIQDVYNLIFDLNEIELQIKKNFNTSVNIVMNFLLEKADNKS